MRLPPRFACFLLLLAPACTDPSPASEGGVDGTEGSATGDGSTQGTRLDDGDGTSGGDDDGIADGTSGDDDDGSSGDDDGPTPNPLCGNGQLDPGEDCDDGNQEADDWCTDACQVATCGDGIVWTAAETCDDGNDKDGDGCSSACGLDSCGDAVLDPGEQCDLGPNNGTNGALCSAQCVSAGVGLAPEQSFVLEETRSVVREPSQIVVDDFDQDGRLDVAVASAVALTFAPGFGGGAFWTPFYVSDNNINPDDGLLAGHVDDDGRVDVVVFREIQNQERVRTYLGGGRALETSAAQETAISTRDGAILADVTGDGLADLLTVGTAQHNIRVDPGTGDGSFGPTTSISTLATGGGELPTRLAVGDVSGDGVADVVAATSGGDIVLVRGLAGGGFAPAIVASASGSAIGDIALADLDGDGRDDVIAAVPEQDEIAVLLASEDGTLGGADDYAVDGVEPVAIAIVELDGDDDPDVVVVERASSSVSVFHGLPGGGVLDVPQALDIAFDSDDGQPINADVHSAVSGDLNEDGFGDVVVDGFDRAVTVLLSDGVGGFQPPRLYPRNRECCDNPAAALADFNDDGHLDLALGNDDGVEILAGTGDGHLLAASNTAGGRRLAVGDVDGDGDPDLALSTAWNVWIQAILGPRGAFETTVFDSEGNGSAGVNDFGALALTDVDGDGVDDVFACGTVNNEVGPRSIWVDPSDGSPMYGLDGGGTGSCPGLVLADVTGDGIVDVVESGYFGVSYMVGLGDHEFTAAAEIPSLADLDADELAVADLDGDGNLDIVVGEGALPGFPPGHVAVALGQGDGVFGDAIYVETDGGGALTSIALGDVNGDLRWDIIASGWDQVWIATGFGNGEFSDPQPFDLERPTWRVTVADVDGDGIDDVFTTAAGDEYVDNRFVLRLSEGHVEL